MIFELYRLYQKFQIHERNDKSFNFMMIYIIFYVHDE